MGLDRPLLGARGGKDAQGASSSCLVGICLVAYVGSGVSQPLVMSAVRFGGLGDTNCQLYMLPYNLGAALTGLFGVCIAGPRWRDLSLRRCVLISILGMLAQSLNYSGNMLAGSAVFAVIYASGTIWSAVLSRLFLQRVLSAWQWAAILLVVLGLVVAQVGAKNDGKRVFEGACMVVVGAAGQALSHVLAELISARGERLPAHVICCVQGSVATAFVGFWQLCYTVPHWDKIAEPLEDAGTTAGGAAVLLGAVALGNFVHSVSFFYLLTSIGAVSTGILKSLQAVIVFTLAHFMYCERDQAQCITPVKGASLAIVVCGVMTYAAATAWARRGDKEAEHAH